MYLGHYATNKIVPCSVLCTKLNINGEAYAKNYFKSYCDIT